MIHRYPSAQYKDFLVRANFACQDIKWPFEPKTKLQVELDIFVHNIRFDLDNCAKPTLDALQKIFGFNDNEVYIIKLTKTVVPKDKEEKTNVYIRETNVE